MITGTDRSASNVAPTKADSRLAEASSEQLDRLLAGKRSRKSVTLQIRSESGHEETVSIPMSAVRLFSEILSEMGKGNAVKVIPLQAELTTQEAAEILNVSRPFLVEQLEQGVIPFRKVGTHRRIQFQDLMSYKQKSDEARLKAVDELAAQAQELGLGY